MKRGLNFNLIKPSVITVFTYFRIYNKQIYENIHTLIKLLKQLKKSLYATKKRESQGITITIT